MGDGRYEIPSEVKSEKGGTLLSVIEKGRWEAWNAESNDEPDYLGSISHDRQFNSKKNAQFQFIPSTSPAFGQSKV